MADFVVIERKALPSGNVQARVRLPNGKALTVTVPFAQSTDAGIAAAVDAAARHPRFAGKGS